MFNLIKNIFPKFLKNILIFFPLLVSNIEINNTLVLNNLVGFVIFCLITLVIYITNDFIDYHIDKLNKLKKNNISKLFNKKIVISLNLLLIPFFFIIESINLFSIFLIFYVLSFYFYTFKGKYIKYLDLIFLNSFFIFRLLYGCDLSNIVSSYWFLIFFSSLFFILSMFKRFIQIKVNKLFKANKIIAYNYKDLPVLKKAINFLLIFNVIVFISYIFRENLNYLFPYDSAEINFDKISYLVVFFIYLTNLFLLVKKLYNYKIKEDIFNYVIKDRVVIFSSILTILIISIPK